MPGNNKNTLYIEHPFLEKIYLSPEPIERGALGKTYISECQQYIVKIPYTYDEIRTKAINLEKQQWFEKYSMTSELSNTISKHCSPCIPKYRFYEEALIHQADRLYQAGQFYNVQSFGLGIFPAENLDVLVMDKYDCVTFAELPYKQWFRYLPQIFTALGEIPHGNICPSNILVDRIDNSIHLIDPAVITTNHFFRITERTEYVCVINVQVSYYPLMPPSTIIKRKSTYSDSYSNYFPLQIPDRFEVNSSVAHEYPDVADIIALGIALYIQATGKHPFPQLINQPLWLYEYFYPNKGFTLNSIPTIKHHYDPSNPHSINSMVIDYINQLLDEVVPPVQHNPQISDKENDYILNLLRYSRSCDCYFENAIELSN